MTRIEVDFNSRDDLGRIPALAALADGPVHEADRVDLFDDEGNRCVAVVVEVGDSLTIQPLWQTFAEYDQPRLSLLDTTGVRADWRNALTVYLRLPVTFAIATSTQGAAITPESLRSLATRVP